MTMMSPDQYLEYHEHKSYTELIRERDRLIDFIREFEKAEMTGAEPGYVLPRGMDYDNAVVMYQMYLQYLSELCKFMQEKYNKEYVCGRRTLKQDL